MSRILSMSLVLCMVLYCGCSQSPEPESQVATEIPQREDIEIPRSDDVLRELIEITFSFSPEKIHFGHVSELIAFLHDTGHKEEARKTLARGIEASKKMPNALFKVQPVTLLLFRAWRIGEEELASQIFEEIETLAQVQPKVMYDVREICYATGRREQADAILVEFFHKFDSLDEKGQGNFLSDMLANEFGDNTRIWTLSHEFDEVAELPSKAMPDQRITNDIGDTSDGVYSEEKMTEIRRAIAPYMERALNLSDTAPGKPKVLEQLTKICLERNLLEESFAFRDARAKISVEQDKWEEERTFQTILWKLTFCAEPERFADRLPEFQKHLLLMKSAVDLRAEQHSWQQVMPSNEYLRFNESNYLANLLRYMVWLGQVEEAEQFAGHFNTSWAQMLVQHEAALRLARQGEYETALKMVESPQQQWPTRREYTLGQLSMIYAKNDQPDWVRKTLEIMDPEIPTTDPLGHHKEPYTRKSLTELVLFYLKKGDFKNVEDVLSAAPKQKKPQGGYSGGAGIFYSPHFAFDVPASILSFSDSYNALTDDAKRRLLHWLLRLTIAEPVDAEPIRKIAWCAIVIDLFKKHGETIPDDDIRKMYDGVLAAAEYPTKSIWNGFQQETGIIYAVHGKVDPALIQKHLRLLKKAIDNSPEEQRKAYYWQSIISLEDNINDLKGKAESEAKYKEILEQFGDPNDLTTLDLPTALKRRDEPFWGGNLFLHYIAQLSYAGRVDEAFEAAKQLRDDQMVPLELIVAASKHGRYDEAMTLAMAQKMDAKQRAEFIATSTNWLIGDRQYADALKSARTIHNQGQRFNNYMYLIRRLVEQETGKNL